VTKLLNAFRADPTDANKARLVKYMAKHPMASCMLMPADVAYLRSAGVLS
jgi:hypothetical protein